MWVPTHYACLVIAILLLESTVLFIYTVIGLLKSNPLPWIMPGPMSPYGTCQDPSRIQQDLRGGPAGTVQQEGIPKAGIHIITSTSMIYQTVAMPTDVSKASAAMDVAGFIKGAAANGVTETRTITDSDGKVTTITSAVPQSTGTNTASPTSSSATDKANESDSQNEPDRAKDSNDRSTDRPTTLSGRDTTDTTMSTKTRSVQYITSVKLLTSTLAPEKGNNPPSTSTTVVVIQPSSPPKL